MQNYLRVTFTDQNSEFDFFVRARNLRLIGSLVFVQCESVLEAQRLLNWIVEVTSDTAHMTLEIDSAIAEMVVIDLCFFEELLNLKIE